MLAPQSLPCPLASGWAQHWEIAAGDVRSGGKRGLSIYPPAPSLLSHFVRILPSTKSQSSYQAAPSTQLPTLDSINHFLPLFFQCFWLVMIYTVASTRGTLYLMFVSLSPAHIL